MIDIDRLERRAQQHDIEIKRLWRSQTRLFQGDAQFRVPPIETLFIEEKATGRNDWPMYQAPPHWELTVPAITITIFSTGFPLIQHTLPAGTYTIGWMSQGYPRVFAHSNYPCTDIPSVNYRLCAVWNAMISADGATFIAELTLGAHPESYNAAWVGIGVVTCNSNGGIGTNQAFWLGAHPNLSPYNLQPSPSGYDFDDPSPSLRDYPYYSRQMLTFGGLIRAVPVY